MLQIAKITRMTIIRSTLMCHSVVITYVILRRLTIKYNDSKLLFRGCFPYDVNSSPEYELTIFAQFAAATYAAASYTAVDTFVAMLILHVCGQLSIVKSNIRNLRYYGEDFRKQLERIVRKHEYLNMFAETIEKCFNMMLLLQMLGCTMQLCFQCFQVIMSIGEANEFLIFQIFFLLLYVVYVMVQLYLYCYVGEKLLIESTEIAEAVYDCEWYNLSPRDAKLLIIIIQRARLPLQVTAGKFCSFTLVLYSQILKTSMGYISVLYATKDK
ncbi:odorant receptor 115 [Calliopsis andreniformis]|uniref:odorant receptor 115 n=1 Tax=Calliopsis andreniformis TaxID=337506 RepID=UPI003FCC38B4